MASDIVPRDPEWEWENRTPRGEVSVFDGDPGTGKSFLSIDLAARKSRGRAYPDGARCELGRVILISAEDSESTIVSRLIVHDADLTNIRIIPSAFERDDGELEIITLPDHLRQIEAVVRADNAKLLVIDPLSAFVSEKIDSHRDASIRRVMAGLTRLAQRTDCTIILIRHLTKQVALENALYRGSGSIGIIGAARSSFLIGMDPTDQGPVEERRVVFAHAKANLGPKTPSLAFGIRVAEGDLVAHVEWCADECKLTANDLLMTAPKPKNRDALKRAMEFFQLELKDGPVESTVLDALADEKGISKATRTRARLKLGVRSDKEGRKWYLSLPDQNIREDV
jgi:AAA domain-containing protein